MQRKQKVAVGFGVFLLLWLFTPGQPFCQQETPAPDAIAKIRNAERVLQIVDQAVAALPESGQGAPSAMARSMLHGTDWIDPERNIVIGVFLQKGALDSPDVAALVPFREPNENFRENYGATGGNDYYVVSLPPGKGGIVSDQMEDALRGASLSSSEGLVSFELAASQILAKAEEPVEKMLQGFEKELPKTGKTGITPEEAGQMFSAFVETCRQLKRVSLGINDAEEKAGFFLKARALAGSDLEAAFDAVPAEKELALAGYKPQRQINFRAGPYDTVAVMDFLDTRLGPLYKQMGIDFGEFKSVMKHLSGEMAGGADFRQNGLSLEIITMLKDTEKLPQNYLEEVYVPWLLDYGREMAQFLQSREPGMETQNLFAELPSSTVSGSPVIGVQFEMPAALEPDMEAFTFRLRMTRMNSMLLAASSDRELKNLMETAENLEKQPGKGPLMEMDMDLTAYLRVLSRMMPKTAAAEAGEPPELGKLRYTLDVADGEIVSRYSMKPEDIGRIAGYINSWQPGPSQAQTRKPAARRKKHRSSAGGRAPEKQGKEEKRQDTARYWIDKGGLYGTYGNTDRAVSCFQKAIELDPDNSRAYYHLAVNYGAAGSYDKAMEAANQAISLDPGNGDHYYARGWIRLLSGKKEQAAEDMKHAAELGQPDAAAYLESIRKH